MERFFLFLASIILAAGVAGSYESGPYEIISYLLFFYFVLDFIYSLGKSFRVLDIAILFSIFQCLIMPVILYLEFNDDYYVRRLEYDMTVSKDEYFSYMIPAVLALIAGIKMPLGRTKRSPIDYKQLINRIKEYLRDKEVIGVYLMGIGISFGILEAFMPQSLQYFLFLFGKMSYVGIYYIYYSESRKRNFYLTAGLIGALGQSIITGIFGDLVYLCLLSLMLLLLGRKVSFSKSLILALLGFFFVLILQTVKGEYRMTTWRSDQGTADKAGVFFNLMTDKAVNAENLLSKQAIFPIVVRFNQGMIIGKVMGHVPFYTDFQEGETIWKSLAASFVPRYLWPDKPTAGGKANMLLFTGLLIQGYSMNVGPYGEAYGNFGVTGGVIYMFFYGLFFNFVFYIILKKVQNHPTLLLWVPYLFLNSIQVETDTLMTVNTIIKGTIFLIFIFWFFKRAIGLKL
jgi:hypothetical protein